jgi:carboxyl-terminal processing protease
VTFTVEREGSPGRIELTLVREIIQVQSVSARLLAPDIGYVRIRQFQTRTARDLEAGLAQFHKSGQVAGIVLDLRNNPGGLLTAAVEVVERFLPGGKLVVYTEGRVRSHNTRFVSRGRRPRTELPLAVLVNQGSASASEIVAAAVQDHGRGTVLGQPSFGKGSVQTIIALSGGAALRLTTARYFTPRGRSINGSGVTPDVAIEPTPAVVAGGDAERQQDDAQLQRAVTHLREVIRASPGRAPVTAPAAGAAPAPAFSTGQEQPSR